MDTQSPLPQNQPTQTNLGEKTGAGDIELIRIDERIEKKILETKLLVTETRLKLVMWAAGGLLAIFGIVVPLFVTFQSSNRLDSAITEMKNDVRAIDARQEASASTQNSRVDKAIEQNRSELKEVTRDLSLASGGMEKKVDGAISQMQAQFKELAGVQLKKPVIECYTNSGQPLQGQVLYPEDNMQSLSIWIRNEGDATARNARLSFYFADSLQLWGDETTRYILSDEPAFKKAFQSGSFSINPGQGVPYQIHVEEQGRPLNRSQILLKVYHEEASAKRFMFYVSTMPGQ